MKLYSLIKNIKCRVYGTTFLDIYGLYHKDFEVKENGLFFCLNGVTYNGNNFVNNAIKNGAVAIVTEQEIPKLYGITQIIVKNPRKIMSLIACNYYENPSKKLKIIGVTGTNGKTSTTTIIANILNNLGKKCAIIGTNGVFIQNKKINTEMTTPDPIELQKILSIIVKKKIKYVCMEISAHASYLDKVDGIKFEEIIFSNLTEDHLDYFKTMENYFYAKKKLFSHQYTNFAIINSDDLYGQKIISDIKIPYLTYAIDDKQSNLKADNIIINENSMSFSIKFFNKNKHKNIFISNNLIKVNTNLIGKFNVYNLLSSFLALSYIGINYLDIINQFSKLNIIDGRFNIQIISGKKIIIDYAHTPDGLLNALNVCRAICGNGRVISVFGCGGNKDKNKRAVMGEISSRLSDYSFVTTDNPRYEKRLDIISDIIKGFLNNNYTIIVDRKIAIKKAFEYANVGDVILIAGKGSENYIEENGKKIFYSDKNEVEKLKNI